MPSPKTPETYHIKTTAGGGLVEEQMNDKKGGMEMVVQLPEIGRSTESKPIHWERKRG
jgi:predicted heme/steroid binding protein